MNIEYSGSDLAHIFQAVADTLSQQREVLNRADSANANHGDHMLAIFQVAARAVQSLPLSNLSDSLEGASRLLVQLGDNTSAQVYARGLEQFGRAFRRHQVEFEDLAGYVQRLLQEPPASSASEGQAETNARADKRAEVMKALVFGLEAWGQVENGKNPSEKGTDVGYLFELGMIYMQAKSRGGSRLDVLSEAAVNASPLSRVPHRLQSGKLAFHALLQAFSVNP
jgi:hypothetical protein